MPKNTRQYTKRRTATGGVIREVPRQHGIAYQVHYNGLHIQTYKTRAEAEARLDLERKNDPRGVLES